MKLWLDGFRDECGRIFGAKIADVVECSRASVTIWVRAYREGGIKQLLERQAAPGAAATSC